MDLERTAAIVTGCGLGLGAATASALAAKGALVYAIDRAVPEDRRLGVPLTVARTRWSRRHGAITYFEPDVTDGAQVHEAVARAAAAPLRTVVNCAGIGPTARILGRNGVHDLALFAQAVRVNLIGSFTVLGEPSCGSERA